MRILRISMADHFQLTFSSIKALRYADTMSKSLDWRAKAEAEGPGVGLVGVIGVELAAVDMVTCSS